MRSLRITCPATSANLGPGFDALGLALNLENTFLVRERPQGFVVEVNGEGADKLAGQPQDNLFVKALQATRQALGLDPVLGLSLECQAGVPLGQGLGSSATAIVAGVLAANALAGEPLDPAGVLAQAARLEGHPDNVTPCLLGGLCVAVQGEGGVLSHLRVEPRGLPRLLLALPQGLQLSTEEMRAALPQQVPFQDAVANVGRASLLVLALLKGESAALQVALEDRLHEPYRGAHIPGFEAVRAAAREAGAWGTVISGAGPALLSFSPPERAAAVKEALGVAWRGVGVSARVLEVEVSGQGASLESRQEGEGPGSQQER